MNDQDTTREALAIEIAKTAEIDNDLDQTAVGDIWLENPGDCADAVIAHLWRRADDPEVMQAVHFAIMRSIEDPGGQEAPAAITATLTALLGTRPEGDTDER